MMSKEHAVVIAGGGPTGLMLAGELALAGVDVAIVERRIDQELIGSRARGLHARSIEVLDQRGIADRFLEAGQIGQVTGYAFISLDISDFPSRHHYGLGLGQNRVEELLAEWVEELSVPFYRGRDITGFVADATGVTVQTSTGDTFRGRYLVGCDGGRSLIRKTAGIEFPGWEAASSMLLAEVETSEEPELGLRMDDLGVQAVAPLGDGGGRYGMVIRETEVEHDTEPTLHDLSEELIAARGTDYGVHSPTWITRFSDMTRQAASYREGRVLLAGDSAHIHSPAGGQGLNLGLQDAVNLGWKLAQVVHGTSPESLLDTYHAERHPVGERVLRATMAQSALQRSNPRLDALRDTVSELLGMDEPRIHIAGMMSGLDIHYDLGEGHPLLGRRMPDLDLATADGPVRVFTLLHDVRPVLLNFAAAGRLDSWADRVRVVDGTYDGAWELPVLGTVSAPGAVLVRPDGHVGWVGEATDSGLAEALDRWVGEPVDTGV